MNRINFSRLFNVLGDIHSKLPFTLGLNNALPPMFVQIEVTHRCNAGCEICYQSNKLNVSDELTLAEIKGLIAQLPFWSILSLTGGEPFIRDDFPAILEYGMKKRKCTVLTNASLITDSHIDLMVRGGLTLLAVSIDGIGAVHDRLRKCPGLFDKAIGTLQKIQATKRELGTMFPLIDIKAVIQKENVGQIYDILELADSISADFVTYSVPRGMENLYSAPYRENLHEICQAVPPCPKLEDDMLELLIEQAGQISNYNGRVKVRTYPENILKPGVLKKFYSHELAPENFKACSLPWSRLSISPHGDVYPCLSYLAGNVRQESLSNIWNGERFKRFRKSLNRTNLSNFCFTCCHSECIALSTKDVNNRLQSKDNL